MAEKGKETKRRREIKDAGQRTVLAAFEIDATKVAHELARAAGVFVSNAAKDGDRGKAMKPFLDRLGAVDGKVQVWVRIGQVAAESRDDAVSAVVGEDEPGQFRAPNASAWRGRVVRRVPERVPLDVQVADD